MDKVKRENRAKFSGWLVSVVGVAIAAVISADLLAANDAARSRFHSEQYLTVVAHPISPQRLCDGERDWVLPGRPPQLVLPKNDTIYTDTWYVQHGAMPASGYYVPITLQGSGSHTVIITDIQIRVVSRRPAFVGSVPSFGGGCGGSDYYKFAADLDTTPVVVKPIDAREGTGKTTAAVPLPHTLSESTPEVWYLEADTKWCACEWEAEIDWTSDGKSGTATVTNNGRPFQTAALSKAHSYVFYEGAFHDQGAIRS